MTKSNGEGTEAARRRKERAREAGYAALDHIVTCGTCLDDFETEGEGVPACEIGRPLIEAWQQAVDELARRERERE